MTRSSDVLTLLGGLSSLTGTALIIASSIGRIDAWDKGTHMILAGTTLTVVGYYRKRIDQRDDTT